MIQVRIDYIQLLQSFVNAEEYIVIQGKNWSIGDCQLSDLRFQKQRTKQAFWKGNRKNK